MKGLGYVMLAALNVSGVAACAEHVEEDATELEAVTAQAAPMVDELESAFDKGTALEATGKLLDGAKALGHDVTTTDPVQFRDAVYQCMLIGDSDQVLCERARAFGVDSLSVINGHWFSFIQGPKIDLEAGIVQPAVTNKIVGQGTNCDWSQSDVDGNLVNQRRFTWGTCRRVLGPLINRVHAVANEHAKHPFPAWSPSSSGHR